LIEQLLEKFVKDPELLPTLLENLQENLKVSDDLECSAIELFNLYSLLLDKSQDKSSKELTDLSMFHFDFEAFYPFNFHKYVQVRLSYLKIVEKILNFWEPEDEGIKLKSYRNLLVLTC
jgi:hypothetical protein